MKPDFIPGAFLIHENTRGKSSEVYFTRIGRNLQFTRPIEAAPYSPLTHLIEGVWNHDSRFARAILRNRLLTPFARTDLCDGMIKVAAKRAEIMSPESFKVRWDELNETEIRFIEVAPPSRILQPDAEKLLQPELGKPQTLQQALEIAEKLAVFSSKRVGAVLLDSENHLLAGAYNSNFDIRTQHAELMMVRNHLAQTGRKFPKHSKLVVTLTPCAMCAAQLLFASDDQELEVFYSVEDPGPLSRNSVLQMGSELCEKAGKPRVKLKKI